MKQGDHLETLGRLDEALNSLRTAEDTFSRLGDKIGVGRATSAIADVLSDRGEDDAARPLYRDALRVDREAGHEVGVANNLNRIGYLLLNRGDEEGAETPIANRSRWGETGVSPSNRF